MIDRSFWQGKRVFITGHTGFKGSWLCLWLQALGAEVSGLALPPHTTPSLFKLSGLAQSMKSYYADIRDADAVRQAIADTQPEIVIHMAAQPLVRASYRLPVDTYETNVMGTVHVLEAVREIGAQGLPVSAVVNVTTDKCYDNREWGWGYRENEALGGYDPYSSSKACSELVTSAYRSSYFNPQAYGEHGTAVASARAGNVIGGGDWSEDRLVPDLLAALVRGEKVQLRNPAAVRPWQHVLEPLGGYLLLAQKLFAGQGAYAEAWNFGPQAEDARDVLAIARLMCREWGTPDAYEIVGGNHPHESHFLKLDISKARAELGWRPHWNVSQAIGRIVEWERLRLQGADMKEATLGQIEAYMLAGAKDDL